MTRTADAQKRVVPCLCLVCVLLLDALRNAQSMAPGADEKIAGLKWKLALISFVGVTVVTSLSAIVLLVLWRDGSWDGQGDQHLDYIIRANGALVATGVILASYLWRIIRR